MDEETQCPPARSGCCPRRLRGRSRGARDPRERVVAEASVPGRTWRVSSAQRCSAVESGDDGVHGFGSTDGVGGVGWRSDWREGEQCQTLPNCGVKSRAAGGSLGKPVCSGCSEAGASELVRLQRTVEGRDRRCRGRAGGREQRPREGRGPQTHSQGGPASARTQDPGGNAAGLSSLGLSPPLLLADERLGGFDVSAQLLDAVGTTKVAVWTAVWVAYLVA